MKAAREPGLVATARSLLYMVFGYRIAQCFQGDKFRHQFVITLDKSWLLEEADHYKYSEITVNEGIGLSRKVIPDAKRTSEGEAS